MVVSIYSQWSWQFKNSSWDSKFFFDDDDDKDDNDDDDDDDNDGLTWLGNLIRFTQQQQQQRQRFGHLQCVRVFFFLAKDQRKTYFFYTVRIKHSWFKQQQQQQR